jgi:hypothetical protein
MGPRRRRMAGDRQVSDPRLRNHLARVAGGGVKTGGSLARRRWRSCGQAPAGLCGPNHGGRKEGRRRWLGIGEGLREEEKRLAGDGLERDAESRDSGD